MASEDIRIVDTLLHDEVDSIADKEASTHYDADLQYSYDYFDCVGLDHEVHAGLEEVSEGERPDQEAQQLPQQQDQQVSIVPHECYFDELAGRQDDAKRQHLHSVALKDAEAPPFVDLLVHYAVKSQEEAEYSAENDEARPLDRLAHAFNHGPVSLFSLQVLKAIRDGKHLVGVWTLRVPVFSVLLGTQVDRLGTSDLGRVHLLFHSFMSGLFILYN